MTNRIDRSPWHIGRPRDFFELSAARRFLFDALRSIERDVPPDIVADVARACYWAGAEATLSRNTRDTTGQLSSAECAGAALIEMRAAYVALAPYLRTDNP